MYVSALKNNHVFRFLYNREELDAFTLYALLHDVGHYPFAHYLEELGKLKGLKLSHTHYTTEILSGRLCPSDVRCEISELVKTQTGNSGDKLIEWIYHDTLLKSIIDGTMDCDKLDYLIRDGIACGVPYANSIDVDRFISSLTCTKSHNNKYRIGVTPKGVSAV
jgi:HD superfamily phosphohydrolase